MIKCCDAHFGSAGPNWHMIPSKDGFRMISGTPERGLMRLDRNIEEELEFGWVQHYTWIDGKRYSLYLHKNCFKPGLAVLNEKCVETLFKTQHGSFDHHYGELCALVFKALQSSHIYAKNV